MHWRHARPARLEPPGLRLCALTTNCHGGNVKIGARYSPLDFLSFRATYSEGFRIPSFAESFAVPSTGFISATADPDWCLANHGASNAAYCTAGYSLGLTQQSSSDLGPETSTNINVGAVLNFGGWSFSADYYKIEMQDVIGGADYNQAVDAYYAGQPIPAGFTVVPDEPDLLFPAAPPRLAL